MGNLLLPDHDPKLNAAVALAFVKAVVTVATATVAARLT